MGPARSCKQLVPAAPEVPSTDPELGSPSVPAAPPVQTALPVEVIETLVPTYRHLSRKEAARSILEEYITLCEAEPYALGLARAVVSSLRTHLRCEASARAIALAVAWPLGQYLGALSSARRWKPMRTRAV